MQGAFDIKNFIWAENKGLFGNSNSHRISEWETKKFDFKIVMEYGVLKKAKTAFQENHESYMHTIKEVNQNNKAATARIGLQHNAEAILDRVKHLKESRTPRELQSKDKKNKGALDLSAQPESFMDKITRQDSTFLNTSDHAQLSEKKSQGSIWLARNFPLSVENFLPVLEFLSKGNNLLQKLDSLLSREESKKILGDKAFPVKLQVPLTLSIKANVTMITCKPLEGIDLQEVFFLPKDCQYINRKQAQKTTIRAKKRMILINAMM